MNSSSFIDGFVPLRLLSNGDDLRLGRLAAGACLVVGGSSVGLAGARFALDDPPSVVGWVVLATALTSFLLLALLQWIGRPQLTGTLLTCAGMLGTCTMALVEGGLFSEGLYFALFVPLLTALFSGVRGAAALAALGTAYMTLLLLLHLNGHDFGKGSAESMAMVLHWMGLVSALGFGAFVGALFENNRLLAQEAQRQTEARTSRLKDEIISVVSHELRTPLTAIRGGLGLLASGKLIELDGQASKVLDLSLRNTDRLGVLINDLLDLQRVADGRVQFHFEVLPLLGLLEQAIELNKPYAGRTHVNLVLVQPVPAVTLRVDGGRMQQILANLLSNAIKFSPRNGTVELKALTNEDRVRLEIHDQGPGIPEDMRTLIFERFSQVDASDRRSKGGSGLGLNIAKSMVEGMDGSIGLTSVVGVGSVFFVELPVAVLG